MRLGKRSFRHKTRIGYHMYFNKRGDKISELEQLRRLESTRYRRVAKTLFEDGTWISTVFLPVNHQMKEVGVPVLFETMIFDTPIESIEGACIRYTNLADAREGHRLMVMIYNRVKGKKRKKVIPLSESP